jgi:hypothetical protein
MGGPDFLTTTPSLLWELLFLRRSTGFVIATSTTFRAALRRWFNSELESVQETEAGQVRFSRSLVCRPERPVERMHRHGHFHKGGRALAVLWKCRCVLNVRRILLIKDHKFHKLLSLRGAFLSSGDMVENGLSNSEAKMNRHEIESRIWGKTIASARTYGIISEQEARFLINEYLQEFREKNGWDGKAYITPRLFWGD